jgi:putative ABC transport system ATP-binding protein
VGFDIALRGVSKHYGVERGRIAALDSITLQIPAGTSLAVTGPSGSGKSTLLHVIGAMDKPDAGTISVDNVEVTTLSAREQALYRRRIGFVFQRFHLLGTLTALDNVVAPVLPRHVDFDKVARARSLLESVGLAGRESSTPSMLSGGEQQRVAIARALINDPGVLLADEPTGNLDSGMGGEILELLLTLRAEHGITIVVASHDPVVAAGCGRVLSLKDGRVIDDVTLPPVTGDDSVINRISRLQEG